MTQPPPPPPPPPPSYGYPPPVFGIYTYVDNYQVHDEMKRHSGRGVGGGIALLLTEVAAFTAGMAAAFLVPLALFVAGGVVWLVKTNGALNRYWQSLGA